MKRSKVTDYAALTNACIEKLSVRKTSHIFSLEGGYGALPAKILKSKKAGEAIYGHFDRTILHSVRTILPSASKQFHRILLPFIVCSFLNIKFKQICILCVLVLGRR